MVCQCSPRCMSSSFLSSVKGGSLAVTISLFIVLITGNFGSVGIPIFLHGCGVLICPACKLTNSTRFAVHGPCVHKCDLCGHYWRGCNRPPGQIDYKPPSGQIDYKPVLFFFGHKPGSCPVCHEPDFCPSGVLTDGWRWIWFGCKTCGHGDTDQPEWEHLARKNKAWQVVA